MIVRPVASAADRRTALALFNAVFPRRPAGEAELAQWERELPERISVLAERDGRAVGAAYAGVSEWLDRPAGSIHVLPDERGRGAGRRLLEALSGWARALGHDSLRGDVEADDATSLAWLARRGFEEHSREGRLVLDLADTTAPDVPPPAGIRLGTWAERPDAGPGLHRVYLECEHDIPGEEEAPLLPYERWLAEDMTGPGDRPEATFVAWEGDEVVGFAKLSLTDAAPEVAFHDLAAVRPAWRGRGIATALKARQIAWAKEAGYARLEAGNEERNEPIRRINARFGYREQPGRVTVIGPLLLHEELGKP